MINGKTSGHHGKISIIGHLSNLAVDISVFIRQTVVLPIICLDKLCWFVRGETDKQNSERGKVSDKVDCCEIYFHKFFGMKIHSAFFPLALLLFPQLYLHFINQLTLKNLKLNSLWKYPKTEKMWKKYRN